MQLIDNVIDQISDHNSSQKENISSAINEALLQVLNEMIDFSDDIEGAIVSSADGIALAEHLPNGLDKHRFAAMSSALLALSDSLGEEGQKGQTQNVLIESVNGKVFLMHAGANLLLTVFTNSQSQLGGCLAYARQATEQIAALADSGL